MMAGYLDSVIAKSCRDMSELPDASIDCVVTSPPYERMREYSADPENLGNYSGEDFVARIRKPLEEVFRVLKPDGSLFLNFLHGSKDGFASCTIHRLPALVEDVGFRIAQTLYWVKTNARPTANPRLLKTAVEPIYHAVRGPDFYVDKSAVRRPSAWAERDPRAWKYNAKGADPGSWLCPAMERLRRMSIQDIFGAVLGPESSALALRKSQEQATVHCAKMPDELADWLIRYGTKTGDCVLDPWAGSGTTLCRAKALGRRYIGYEIVPEYAGLAEERLARVTFGEALDGVQSLGKPANPQKQKSPIPAASVADERECRQCGEKFEPKKKWQAYCKRKCHDRHHNSKRRNNGKR